MQYNEIVKWFNRIPQHERDLPIIMLEGKPYTPRQIYEEVLKGTALGKKLSSLILTKTISSPVNDISLAKIRLIEILKRYPQDKPIIASYGRTYTPSQLKDEIIRETEIGKKWIENEINKIKQIMVI